MEGWPTSIPPSVIHCVPALPQVLRTETALEKEYPFSFQNSSPLSGGEWPAMGELHTSGTAWARGQRTGRAQVSRGESDMVGWSTGFVSNAGCGGWWGQVLQKCVCWTKGLGFHPEAKRGGQFQHEGGNGGEWHAQSLGLEKLSQCFHPGLSGCMHTLRQQRARRLNRRWGHQSGGCCMVKNGSSRAGTSLWHALFDG